MRYQLKKSHLITLKEIVDETLEWLGKREG